MANKKILFITTGGTIACVKTQGGLAPLLTSEALAEHLPDLTELCEVEMLSLCSVDSTDITPKHWLLIAQTIEDEYEHYDGFIICHGTDTLAYTAAALSYLIRGSDKPIIITGSQQPISAEITDAKKNLHDSVIVALDPESHGVMVVFGGQVIAGTRAKKHKTISYDAFSSINFPSLGQVQGNRLVRYIETKKKELCGVVFYHALSSKIFLLKLTPGMQPELLQAIFDQYDCVIVESFGVGGIPNALMEAFIDGFGAYENTHKILVMTTQVTYEGSDVSIYEVGQRVQEKISFLEAHDMTIEAVVTKCMWLLAQGCEDFASLQECFYERVNFDTFFIEDKYS